MPIHEQIKPENGEGVQAYLNKTEHQILKACTQGEKSSRELLDILGYKTRTRNLRDALSHLLKLGLITYTIPDRHRHPDQKHTITKLGRKKLVDQ